MATKQKHCVLDLDEIDAYDEIDGSTQLCLVYCLTHKDYSWHWLDRSLLDPRYSSNRRVELA